TQLGKASSMIFSQSNFPSEKIRLELISLCDYVYTLHNSKIRNLPNNLSALYSGKHLTTNSHFKLAFDLQIAISQTQEYGYPIAHLVKTIKRLEKHRMNILVCLGYRVAGMCARKRQEYILAHKFFDAAMAIARQLGLHININQLHNARAYTSYSQGKIELAEQTLLKIIPDGPLDPILPILGENLALIAEKRQDPDLAVEHIKKALDVALQLDSVSRLPGECLYLGDIYRDHYGDLAQAEYYYKLGFDHSQRYAEHGISLTGDRKKVTDAYLKISRAAKVTVVGGESPVKIDHFSFAGGKPWKEIKDIFQYQLILHHTDANSNSKRMAKKLGLPASTLYSIQNRLKSRGYQLPARGEAPPGETHELQTYLNTHTDLSWDEVNQIFEREMIHYLYAKYGYNKHRMANILDLSYPSIIDKTRELTRIDAHFLAN
ncbi:MAG: hypothetical protein L3J79_07405, partial [Candidatus Marinimicrobia bacterium]|nr:hypothetical protein [Candidatus Neomarinimicrobiota bacterium]